MAAKRSAKLGSTEDGLAAQRAYRSARNAALAPLKADARISIPAICYGPLPVRHMPLREAICLRKGRFPTRRVVSAACPHFVGNLWSPTGSKRDGLHKKSVRRRWGPPDTSQIRHAMRLFNRYR